MQLAWISGQKFHDEDGDGSLAPRMSIDVDQPRFVTTGDFDGDGDRLVSLPTWSFSKPYTTKSEIARGREERVERRPQES